MFADATLRKHGKLLSGERCSTEATDRLRQLAGGRVRLQDGPRLTDDFGRRLAYLFTTNGSSIDVLMIGEGLAEAWTRDGQHRDTLVGLEDSARQNGPGCLWG
jgi:endonuclease YncB( thermonuclease family)